MRSLASALALMPLLLGAAASAAAATDVGTAEAASADAAIAAVEVVAPVEAPPVEAPPVEAPPVEAPPVEAAPVEARTADPASHAAAPGDPDTAPTVGFELPPPVPNEAWYQDTVEVVIVARSRVGSIESVTWTLSGAQTGGGTVLRDARFPVTVDGQGVTTLTVSAADSDGNVSEDFQVLIKIDRTPPTMVVTGPAPGAHRFGSPIFVKYVCADPESGIDRTNIDQCFVDFYLDGVRQGGAQTSDTWMPREEGLYEVRAWARNNADRETNIVVGMLNVVMNETEAPDVTVTTPAVPASGWFDHAVTLELAATDAGAGVDYLEYRTGGPGAWGAWVAVHGSTASVVTPGTGVHHYEVRAVDYFGNASDPVERRVAVDVTPPAVVIDSPADGVEVELGDELTALYGCTEAGSGLASCEGTVPSGGDLDTSVAGSHTWSVTAIDQAGNITRVERGYTVVVPDTSAPTVTVDAPPVPASGWYTTAPTFTFTAEDPSGVAELRWTLTTPRGGQSSGTETSGTWTVDGFLDGATTITYVATDALGNESALQTVTVRLDREAPWIEVRSPASHVNSLAADEDIVQGATVELHAVCDDLASGVVSCESSVGWVLPTDVVGTHEAVVTAVDRAGHRQTATLEYTVVAAPQPQPTPVPQPQTGGGAASDDGGGGLASTGVETGGMLGAGLGLLGIGALVAAAGLLRRRRIAIG